MVFPADSAARIDLGSVKSAELEESIGELETIRDFERFLRDAGGLSKGLAEALVSRAKLIFVQGSLSRSQPTRKQCRNCRQCCSECKRESRCNPPFIKNKARHRAGFLHLWSNNMSDIAAVMKACEAIEAQLVKFADKTEAELKNAGSTSADTKAAVDGLSIKQRELADRILQIEQKSTQKQDEKPAADSWGDQFIKSARYGDFAGGNLNKLRVEVKTP